MSSRFGCFALSLLALAPGLLAAPAPAPAPAAAGTDLEARYVPQEPPGIPRGIRGDTDFIGPDGHPLNSPVRPIQYSLVNGQSADKDLGIYLDFTSTPNPQPLRGNAGYLDPGPRMYSF